MDRFGWRLPALALTAASMVTGAAAQDACGGAGASGQWIGGAEATSDIATADTFKEQMALVLGGNQHVALFTLSADTAIRVEAQGRGSGDPLIDLVDGDGNIILSDDDSGGNGAARAEVDLTAGTYCLTTTSYDGAPMTAFVRIGRTDQEPLTEGIPDIPEGTDPAMLGSCADAAILGTFAGSLMADESAENAPYWRFTLTEPTAISIIAENIDADPSITLYDAAENYLNENDDSDGLNSRIDMPDPLPAGDYCLQVNALTDTTLPIHIEVMTYDPVAALNALYASGEAAPPLDGSIPFTALGALSNRLRQDAQISDKTTWFTVDIAESSLLLVEAIAAGGNGDPWLVIYDDLGRQVAQNDDYGTTFDSLATARVNPGTYLIGVKQASSGTSGFIRLLFERYIPAP